MLIIYSLWGNKNNINQWWQEKYIYQQIDLFDWFQNQVKWSEKQNNTILNHDNTYFLMKEIRIFSAPAYSCGYPDFKLWDDTLRHLKREIDVQNEVKSMLFVALLKRSHRDKE